MFPPTDKYMITDNVVSSFRIATHFISKKLTSRTKLRQNYEGCVYVFLRVCVYVCVCINIKMINE